MATKEHSIQKKSAIFQLSQLIYAAEFFSFFRASIYFFVFMIGRKRNLAPLLVSHLNKSNCLIKSSWIRVDDKLFSDWWVTIVKQLGPQDIGDVISTRARTRLHPLFFLLCRTELHINPYKTSEGFRLTKATL